MSDNRVERKCSRKRSPKRLPVSPMNILLQVRHLIAYTTFSLTQVYLDWTVMCPPVVAIEAMCAGVASSQSQRALVTSRYIARAFLQLPPLRKREHPRNVWFFRAFSTHIFINFVNIFELLRCTVFSNFL